jgi:hypothetical protein
MHSILVALAALLPGTADAAIEGRQALYLGALGKGGLWGLGYESLLSERWAAGAAGSYYMLDGKRFLTLSPYLALYPVVAGAHRGVLQAGPQLLRESTMSPVPEWQGTRSTRLGSQLSAGYEYRERWLFRAYGMVSAGSEGIAPWLGIDLGFTF